jgi:hypothetical protein
MIFLSASIPNQKDSKYFETADLFAIRDAVRALATVVIPYTNLVWGGHPAITPLIRYVLTTMDINVHDRVTLYLSNFYQQEFIDDNSAFGNVILVDSAETQEDSLKKLREQMFTENKFSAGIFIGGMKGVEDEFELFKHYQPHALLLPVGSTGGASRLIYDSQDSSDEKLLKDYAYMSVFKTLLKDHLNS